MSMLTPLDDANLKRSMSPEELLESSPATKRSNQDWHDIAEAGKLSRQEKDLERLRQREKKDADKKAGKLRKDLERKAEKDRREAERRAEKERKEAEKAAERERKEAERLAEKERKEAEKIAEKERKEAEKLAEKERKDAEKLAEKERKEAEKLAEKERKNKDLLKAQPKINLFFKKTSPSVVSNSPHLSDDAQRSQSNSAEANLTEATLTDYQKYILPFHVKANAQLFSCVCNYRPSPLEYERDPKEWLQSLKLVPGEVSGNQEKLTSHQFRTQLLLARESAQVAMLLKNLRVRRLQFSHLSARYAEDPTVPINEEFRPPYVGSTKDIERCKQLDLAVNPFRTDLDDSAAYGYDSEVEWDHEDGEDLRDEDGDDSDEDIGDQDELKEFLSSDDDDPTAPKRSKVIGPLTPVVIWRDSSDSPELGQFAIELLQPFPGPRIDHQNTSDQIDLVSTTDTSSMATVESVLDPLVKKVGFEPLRASIVMYNGSTSTKTLIIELWKQEFSSATSSEIRAAFDICMERVGKKRSEKRWVLSNEASQYFSVSAQANNDHRTPPSGCISDAANRDAASLAPISVAKQDTQAREF